MSMIAKNFDNLATSWNILHNYFDSLFDDLLIKFLDISAKPFFLCRLEISINKKIV